MNFIADANVDVRQ